MKRGSFILSIYDAIIQGVVQGLTEFLPVSSDGHLTLVQHFTGKSSEGAMLFSILLHIGTLLSVFVAFRKTIAAIIIEFFSMLKDIFSGKFTFRAMNDNRRMIFLILFSLIPLIGFYFVKDFFRSIAEDGDILIEGILFIVTGLMLYFADRVYPGNKSAADMGLGDSLLVGAAQGFAALPAISRSGSTISTMILRGYDKEFTVTFSFLMGIPAILGANIFEISDAVSNNKELPLIPAIIGIIVAFLVGLVAIKFLTWIVESDRLNVFAYYTIFLGGVVIVIALIERIIGMSVYQMISGVLPYFDR